MVRRFFDELEHLHNELCSELPFKRDFSPPKDVMYWINTEDEYLMFQYGSETKYIETKFANILRVVCVDGEDSILFNECMRLLGRMKRIGTRRWLDERKEEYKLKTEEISVGVADE